MKVEKGRRLGRGLEALLAPSSRPAVSGAGPVAPRSGQAGDSRPGREGAAGFESVPVASVFANPNQPRRNFDPRELAELERSISANGLLQPILVRPRGNRFEIVAGERRFRAVQSLGWTVVPAQIRELSDQDVLTLALVENLQRADLNPIEEAEGYQQLMSRYDLTQQQVADIVARDRSTIANVLRLLSLPDTVLGMVRRGELNLGQARALLGARSPSAMASLAERIVSEGWTVREIERRVREDKASKRSPKSGPPAPGASASLAPATPTVGLVEDQLRRRFQTDVKVSLSGDSRGDVRIAFYSNDDFERLLDLLLGTSRDPV
ncbi:MAG: ParB/RepB/Spo0J family partition protein [Gemmatimonadetes bacterium]|nr:ParB/RepB/Spo0J family partition protein [Gemmatimonadota bacterium]